MFVFFFFSLFMFFFFFLNTKNSFSKFSIQHSHFLFQIFLEADFEPPKTLWIWSGISLAGYFGLSKFLTETLPKFEFFQNLSAKKQREFTPYCLSLVNALITSGYSWLKENSVPSIYDLSPKGNLYVASTFFSYLCVDLYSSGRKTTIPNFLHHFSLILGIPVQFYNRGCLRLVPPVLGMETSTVFLDLLWLGDTLHFKSNWFRYPILLLFVLSFSWTRLYRFPKILYELANDKKLEHDKKQLGKVVWVLYILVILQWFWGWGIMKKIQREVFGGASMIPTKS